MVMTNYGYGATNNQRLTLRQVRLTEESKNVFLIQQKTRRHWRGG